MLRTALLGGNTITLDADLSKYIETVSDQGVIEGLEVNSNSVAPGKAWVKATRSNGETIMVLVQNTEALTVDTSGTKKIWLEIKQEAIDNGLLNNEDGTGIASIKTGPTLPSQNSLLLASVADGVVKDERNLIPKIQSVAQRTDSLEEKLSTAEGQISQLVEAGTPSYLGITAIVGEKYTMEDTLFLQKTPTLADSTIAINVGDVAANKEQHIQRISSGESSNQLKLKMGKFGAPTTSVIVEVRKGIKVDVSEKEAYWYGGDELLASASLPYTTFQTEGQEITVNLNQAFQLPKGELYSVVVKQENGIVNAQNFYRLYCDSTQYSEAFSSVMVNGSSRVRSKLMPYCVSGSFLSELGVKANNGANYSTHVSNFNFLKAKQNKKEKFRADNYEELNQSVTFDTLHSKVYYVIIKNNTAEDLTFYSIQLRDGNQQNHFRVPAGESRTLYATATSNLIGVSWTNVNFASYVDNRNFVISLHWSTKDTAPTVPITMQNKNTKGKKPRSLEVIGEMVSLTYSGVHIDGSMVPGGGYTTTTVITGSIHLGNAVGYLSTYLSNGKEVLVPYYNKPG